MALPIELLITYSGKARQRFPWTQFSSIRNTWWIRWLGKRQLVGRSNCSRKCVGPVRRLLKPWALWTLVRERRDVNMHRSTTYDSKVGSPLQSTTLWATSTPRYHERMDAGMPTYRELEQMVICTNRLPTHLFLTVGCSQSPMSISRNPRFWLADSERKARIIRGRHPF